MYNDNHNNPIPAIPDIKLPDPAAPLRKRIGIALAGIAGALALCCALTAGIGIGIGAIRLNNGEVVRGISTPEPVIGSAPAADNTVASAQSITATPSRPSASAANTTKPNSGNGSELIIAPAPAAAQSPDTALSPDTAPIAPALDSPLPAAPPTAAPTPAPVVQTPPDVTERQLRIFEALWETVDANYIYPDFNGLDWDETRAQVRARIEQGMTDEAFHAFLGQTISSLNDEHSFYLSPSEARQEDEQYNGTFEYAGVGIITDVNRDKGYIYVLQVLDNSPAQAAGIRPHDHILSIDGAAVFDDKGESQSARFRGAIGSPVTALVRTPGKAPREVTLTRSTINAKERVEYKLLQNGTKKIGYILIPTLMEEDIDERVRNALRMLTTADKLDGLIIDLRINSGGALDVLSPTLGFFTKGDVGRLVNRRGARLTIRARAENIGNSQTVPIAVLIGNATESYAEVLAGALHARGRAKLIGRNSAGNIETLRAREFEDGSRLWLAEEGFRLMNGESWEGSGLKPDIVVPQGWDEHTDEDDPAIAIAVQSLIE
jgi:carboxyl-terminal processing protease